MLHATTEAVTSNHVATRQQQARDSKPQSPGFSDLLATSAPSKNEPPRPSAPRENDAPPRLTSSQRNQQPDDRAVPDSDEAPSTAASNAPADQPGKPCLAASEKAMKSASEIVSSDTTDKPAATASVPDPTSLIIAAANPVAVDNPAAVAVPVPVAGLIEPQAVPQPAPAPSGTAPLTIAAAAIATSKPAPAKTSVLTGEPDANDKPTAAASPAPASNAAQAPATDAPAKTVTADVQTVATPATERGDGKPAHPDQPPASSSVLGKADAKPASNILAPKAGKNDAIDANATPTPAVQPKSHDTRVAPAAAATTDLTVTADATPALPQVQTVTNPTTNPASPPTIAAAPTAPVPLAGLAVELAARAHNGASRFEIRLDPADLGRIDVRIDVDKQGQVTSHLTVEKPETLAMLRQDAPQLQRALNDAGLKTGDGALQFAQGDQSQSQRHADNGDRQAQRLIIRDDETLAIPAPLRSYGRPFAARGGIDISV